MSDRRAQVRSLILTLFWGLALASPALTQESKSDPYPTLDYRRWSGAINVPDPVAISVADNGDVYVTQTQRRKIQDLDIRSHSRWIPDDVGLTSVTEKRDFLRRMLPIGGDAKSDVQDVNQDGAHDWRDLTVISEKIHRLTDTDGDGTADRINLFAEDFKTEVTGIAAGVLHWQGSVWATIAPDVWKLTDTNGDGTADQRKVMATGFGLHIAYAGHDMHGLTVGPDGKIYWSIGDKGIAVTTADGQSVHYPNQGGVMRCNPDGTDFEVFAHGLRNVQEIAFDPYGNLFGVDNDADQPGEKERFVWIVDQMDAGWRCNYQYRKDGYNPWTDEKLWQVAGEGHPAYLVPPIANYIDGPAGFKFNPGAALSPRYRDFFFLTGAPNGNQYAFRVEPDGDSWRMVDDHQIGQGDPIVGIAFGPDGGLYGVDWGGGYPLTQTGSVIRIDVPDQTLTDNFKQLRRSVRDLLRDGMQKRPTDSLVALLGHVDQRIRMRAQFELVRRSELSALQSVIENTQAETLARVHAIWGLGQLIRYGKASPDVMHPIWDDPDAKIRMVGAKTLGECEGVDAARFTALLQDADPHVRIHAALALARQPSEAAVPPLIELARKWVDGQHYLRHAVVTGLAACAPAEQLVERAGDPSESVRLFAALALRRQMDPAVAVFLDDASTRVATEAARAIHDDVSIPKALPALALSLEQRRDQATAMVVRAINANFRLGDRDSLMRVLRFAGETDRSAEWREVACDAIAQWTDPPVLDRVDGRRRSFASERELDRDSVESLLANLLKGQDTRVRVAAVKAARNLSIPLSVDSLISLVNDVNSPTALRLQSLRALTEESTVGDQENLTELLVRWSDDASPEVAAAAVTAVGNRDPEALNQMLERSLVNRPDLVAQAGIESLANAQDNPSVRMLIALGSQLADGQLRPELSLDAYRALRSRVATQPDGSGDGLQAVLNQVESLPALADLDSSALREFAFAGAGGDAARGEKIFRTDVRLQCSRCHRVGKKGSDIGPELTRIAKKRDAQSLLRSVVYPSAEIEPKYSAQTLLLSDGSVVQGVIKSEDDETTVVIDSKGKERVIVTDEIEDVAKTKASLMPDMTAVFDANEVRDLVAYLMTLR